MQVVNILDAGWRDITSTVTHPNGDVDIITTSVYYLESTPGTVITWSADVTEAEPFTMSSPWDYIFKSLIDRYGPSFVGKTVTLDLNNPDGNILVVR